MAKIMIVEDEVITAMAMGSTLKKAGHEILGPAISGERAIQQIEQERPDVVLMDISLRGKLNGIEAAHLLRDRWGIPVIFTTGYADRELVKKLTENGFSHCFIKPLDMPGIMALIDSIATR